MENKKKDPKKKGIRKIIKTVYTMVAWTFRTKKTNKKVEILKLVLLLTVLQTVQVRRWNYLFYISKTLGKDFSEPYPGKHKAEIKKKRSFQRDHSIHSNGRCTNFTNQQL